MGATIMDISGIPELFYVCDTHDIIGCKTAIERSIIMYKQDRINEISVQKTPETIDDIRSKFKQIFTKKPGLVNNFCHEINTKTLEPFKSHKYIATPQNLKEKE
ncbi:hypothetical protein A3Q56_04565, partial [Intoshia linei]